MSPEDKLLALLPELTEEEKDRRTREGLVPEPPIRFEASVGRKFECGAFVG